MHRLCIAGLVLALACCGDSPSPDNGPAPTAANQSTPADAATDAPTLHQVSLTWQLEDSVPPKEPEPGGPGSDWREERTRREEWRYRWDRWIARHQSWYIYPDLKFEKMLECGYRVVKRDVNGGQVWALLEGDDAARTKLSDAQHAAIVADVERMQRDSEARSDSQD